MTDVLRELGKVISRIDSVGDILRYPLEATKAVVSLIPDKVVDGIWSVLSIPLNAIKALISGTTDKVSDVKTVIVDKSVSIQNNIISIKETIINLPTQIGIVVNNTLTYLFIPEDTYIPQKIDGIKDSLSKKLSVESYNAIFADLQNTHAVQEYSDVALDKLKIGGTDIPISKTSFVDKVPIDSMKEKYFPWIRGVTFILLLLYNYNMIYKLVRGTDLVGVSNTINHMKGGEG